MISVAILTLNEEEDLPNCLGSLAWCDDIHVIDSGSTDNTVALANAARAYVHHHQFESFGRQRNWALVNCTFRYNWVLFLDADECSTPEFHRALVSAVESAPEAIAGFYLCWKMMLDDVWLKHCDSFPKWQFRLVRLEKAAFEDFGHGQKEHAVQGRLDYIREPYLHYAFSKGWARWMDRHNRYSDQEATKRLRAPIIWRDVFSSHGSVRNKALKPLVSRIPGWPLAAFFFRYVVKLGFLEGRPGFVYCVNMAYYEFLIRIKMDQARRSRMPTPETSKRLREFRMSPRIRGVASAALFTGTLIAALYFALVPNVQRDVLSILPAPIRSWCGLNDDLSNFLLFAILSFATFRLRIGLEDSATGRLESSNYSLWKRLIGLLSLVAGLEVIQIWIPGRFSSMRDVLTGGAGVFTALILTRIRNVRSPAKGSCGTQRASDT